LLRQADRIVLLGLQRTRHLGVYYARTGQYRSPLPAIRATIREYEGRIKHLQGLLDQGDTLAKEHIANVTRRLTEDLGDIARSEGRTRAWPLAGGRVAWERQAAELAPDWAVGRS